MQTFTLDGNAGDNSILEFETFTFSGSWSGLTQISYEGINGAVAPVNLFAVDNIVVNTSASVPETPTLALFALGLAGLGFARRKKVQGHRE